MTAGMSTVNLVNAWLDVLSGTSFTGVATPFVQLHTGDPGAAGTANVSSTTTRKAISWAAASGGSKALSSSPSWTAWSGTNGEVVTHVSIWSAASSGTFYWSAQLSSSKTVNTGDTLTLNTLTLSATPLAA